MTDEDPVAAGRLWRWLRLLGLGTAMIFLIGVGTGFLMGHVGRHGGFGARPALILGAILLLLGGCIWLLVRELRRPTGEEPLTPKERLNRNILLGCGALGAAMGIGMSFAGDGSLTSGGGVFSNDPLPTWLAIVLVLIIGLVTPVLSIIWHRTVDEQEVDAYKMGALYAFYVYAIGAPLWWMSWRGGFAPEPNGFVIYFAAIFTALIVWTWKKYR
jgi:hypothetical protein